MLDTPGLKRDLIARFTAIVGERYALDFDHPRRRRRGRPRRLGRLRRGSVGALPRIDPAVLNAALQHLLERAGVFDQETIAPEGMIQPVAFQGMQVHPDGKLVDGYFLQHGWTLSRAKLPSVYRPKRGRQRCGSHLQGRSRAGTSRLACRRLKVCAPSIRRKSLIRDACCPQGRRLGYSATFRLVKRALPSPVPMVSTPQWLTSVMCGNSLRPCTTASLCITTTVS